MQLLLRSIFFASWFSCCLASGLAASLLACAPRSQQAAARPEGDEALFIRLGGQRAVATLAADWSALAGGQQPAELAELLCAVSMGPCDAPAVTARWRAHGLAQDRVAELLRSLEQTLERCHIAVPERSELLKGVRGIFGP